jgi:hypothetical protein
VLSLRLDLCDLLDSGTRETFLGRIWGQCAVVVAERLRRISKLFADPVRLDAVSSIEY